MLKKGFGGIIWIAWRKHLMRNFPNLSAAPRCHHSSACDTCVALKFRGRLTQCDYAVTTTRTCVGLPVGASGGECPCSCVPARGMPHPWPCCSHPCFLGADSSVPVRPRGLSDISGSISKCYLRQTRELSKYSTRFCAFLLLFTASRKSGNSQ